MRGDDRQQAAMWSHISPEQRVPPDHPLRPILAMVDGVLRELSPRFEALYAKRGRPSIAPEKRRRALVLQLLYSVRSERLLMEQLDSRQRCDRPSTTGPDYCFRRYTSRSIGSASGDGAIRGNS